MILFDIDGTLISPGGAGTRSLDMAFHELLGIRNAFRDIPMAGKTDIQIIKEGLGAHGISNPDGKVEKIRDLYLDYLGREIDNPRKSLKPGIKEILDLLREMKMPVGLLTGNLETGARIKLDSFGLNEYFLDGAFGSDDEDRDRLLPIALKKFAAKGFAFTAGECIIVGDTPRDVKCAKIHGARCVAVASGPYPKEDLLRTDADMVFDSLEDISAFMDFLGY
ncbi:MAG: HAD family hydrolase [Nitrospiraceae bacterium]|nr:MAG: HAD family hydrolase [Nitrospiraceae bacterium]